MTNLLLKTGNCHGLSKVANEKVASFKVNDRDSFKKIVKTLSHLIDLKILEKPNLEMVELRIEKYLRSFIKWKNNILSLELLTHQEVEKATKIDIRDCVRLLSAFKHEGLRSESCRDYLMFVIQENLGQLNNEL